MPLPPGRSPLPNAWFSRWFNTSDIQEVSIPQVSRIEVIDERGRSYVTHHAANVMLSLQDGGRTLKIFTQGTKDV
jgi:hypothetical protein